MKKFSTQKFKMDLDVEIIKGNENTIYCAAIVAEGNLIQIEKKFYEKLQPHEIVEVIESLIYVQQNPTAMCSKWFKD